MKRWVVLALPARVFAKDGPFGTCFTNTGKVLPAGTKVEIGEAMRAFVSKEDSDVAVPFDAEDGKTYWILSDEAAIDPDEVPGIEQIWLERFDESRHYIDNMQSKFIEEFRRRQQRGEEL